MNTQTIVASIVAATTIAIAASNSSPKTEAKVEQPDSRVDQLSVKVNSIETKLDRLAASVDSLGQSIGQRIEFDTSPTLTSPVDRPSAVDLSPLEARLTEIESRFIDVDDSTVELPVESFEQSYSEPLPTDELARGPIVRVATAPVRVAARVVSAPVRGVVRLVRGVASHRQARIASRGRWYPGKLIFGRRR